MKSVIFILSMLSFFSAAAQVQDIDLSEKKGLTIKIDLETKFVRLVNRSKNVTYKLEWEKKTIEINTPFDISALSSNDSKLKTCTQEVKDLIANLDSEDDEAKIKTLVDNGRKLITKLGNDNCATILKKSIDETEQIISIPFIVQNNQVITLSVNKVDKTDKSIGKWSYTLKTPEKSRWLIHYGLTYTPSLISKVDHYHAFADTSVANRYTINKNNDNGPKAWENISATINFTYPFHGDSRNFDGGFTAGFGINAGLELSGHAGLSAIIGENVILSTGIAFMQKQKLKGQYKEGQIIKENLSFDALHEKVWVPEVFFTIGFRFGSNPFVKKESKTATSTTTEE